ncbi:creatininase family protein [Chloroflexota bacterium]
MKKVLWQELRRTEVEQAAKANAVVIIPVASTEQHGEHLPVNTDANACFTIALRAAQAIDEFPVLVLPVIWTGYSPEHITYPGVITLEFHTFVDVLTQVAVSVYAQGFRKIFFLNGHGSNRFIIAAMRRKLASEQSVPATVGYTWWEIPSVNEEMKLVSQSDIGNLGHAGELETSIQLYLQPQLVDRDAISWVRGVWGNPSTGTREKGERLIRAAVDGVISLLRDYHSGKLEESQMLGKGVFEGKKSI